MAETDKQAVEDIYRRWAPVYDLVFSKVFERGRKAVVAAGERIGGRVLEVGVGTGISLPYYSGRCRVVGIDLSEEMLQKARQRVKEGNLSYVEDIAIMDAEHLDFPDASFDVVTAQCVVNTVPHPDLALAEFARVLKPGGEIVLFNRVSAESGARHVVEQILQPIVSRLGWRSEFPWAVFDRWASGSPHGIYLIDRAPMPPFGHFSVIRFGKTGAQASATRVSTVQESAREESLAHNSAAL